MKVTHTANFTLTLNGIFFVKDVLDVIIHDGVHVSVSEIDHKLLTSVLI